MDESPKPSVGWELAVPRSQPSQTMALAMVTAKSAGGYLDVDEQLPQVPRGHHHGRVQLCDVALVQSNVIVSCKALQ